MRTYTQQDIIDITQYLATGKLPASIANDRVALWRFQKLYTADLWGKRGEFLTELKTGRRVVPIDKIQGVLQHLYNDPATTLNGRDRLYYRVKDMYIGTTKVDVQEFLKRQETYQLHAQVKKDSVVKPIVPSRKDEHWQVDTIVMKGQTDTAQTHGSLPWFNKGYTNIMTVIDLFSKYAWAEPLKDVKERTIIAALRSIMAGSGRVPAKLQSDNGPEFGSGSKTSEYAQFLAEMNITQLHSRSHTPQTQGGIEKFNRTLKQSLYDHFTQQKTKNWISVLDTKLANYNSAYHTTIKNTPAKVSESADKHVLKQAKEHIENQAEKALEGHHHEALEKGDYVRTAKVVDSAELRALELHGFSKSYKQQWGKDIYIVWSVSRPAQDSYKQPTYTLYSINEKGEAGIRIEKPYYRWQLQKVGSEPADLQKIVKIGSKQAPLAPRIGREKRSKRSPELAPQEAAQPEEVPLRRSSRARKENVRLRDLDG